MKVQKYWPITLHLSAFQLLQKFLPVHGVFPQ